MAVSGQRALNQATLIAASIAGLAGLASAAILGWALGNFAVALVYAALILTAAGFGLAFSTRRRVEDAAIENDWPLIRGILDASSLAMALTSLEGRLTSANRAWATLIGSYIDPTALARDGEAVERLDECRRLALRDGIAKLRLQMPDGAKVAEVDVCIRQVAGSTPYLLWTVQPSAAIEMRRQALQVFDARLGRWLGRAGVPAVLVDATGRILTANRSFRTLATGEADGPIAGTILSDCLRVGHNGLVRFANHDGEQQPMRLVELDCDIEGEPEAAPTYLFMLVELPSLPSSEAAGVASLEELLATLPLGLALTDRGGRFQFLNEAFMRATDLFEGPDPLYPGDLVVDEDKAMVADALRTVAGGRQTPRDLRIRLRSRPDEPVMLTVAQAGGVGSTSLFLCLKDNSEQEKLERQVAQATKMQAVGQLAGGVAHDFNNILTAVIGYCDLILLRHSPGDSDFDDITQIKQNANRAANLVRQLLAFSRQQTLLLQVLQISDVVADLSHMLKRLLGEQVRLTVKHGRNLGPVRVDPGQLEQVIVNLAVNARDAMPEGGELLISTYAVSAAEARRMGSDILPAANYTVLRVEDSGQGIPADVLPKVFEPFFTTKEVGKGTGLGLSTVYGIVKQSGGFIFVDSEEGRGTAFSIYLPVHTSAEPLDMEETPPAAEPPQAPSELWGIGSVLLVEDEAMVRAVAERALTRKGYKVLTAVNGEDALDILRGGEDIDLLVTDVVMPVMDGPTLVGHAREMFPDLPIVFMSGYAEEQLRRSIDVAGVAFLPKPFSVQQLAEAVGKTLARARRDRA